MSGFFDLLSEQMGGYKDDTEIIPGRGNSTGMIVSAPVADSARKAFAKELGSNLQTAGNTLAGISSNGQSAKPAQQPAPAQPQVSAFYGNGFGGGSSGPTPTSPNHGASSDWGSAPAPVPAPAVAPQAPPVPQPPIPQPAPQSMVLQPQQLAQLGQPMVYSDRNLKTNISNTSKSDISNFIKSISVPKNYDYKDSANGPHTKGGLMAQDLEKSNIGKSAVINTPKGKAVDTARLMTIMASTTAHKLNEFDRKIEEALNQKFKKGKK